MKKIIVATIICFFITQLSHAQYSSKLTATQWVDSVFKKLNRKQKIAQLMIIRAHSNLGADHVAEVTKLIKKYNVGGLCFFQGGPVRQANLTNYYQSIAKTPLMITIDGEWGLGMRLDSVINFPRNLLIGAVNDPKLVYNFGRAVGEQCKRIGIHVNFGPVVDVNNNPKNPVINDRSFGEDKYKVASYGIEYMKGMQDVGVMACAKHFPGHGDVEVDSHYDLPVINKTREQLDSLELYPFKQILKAGVGSVMVAHLYIPSIDTTTNQATSLSYKNVTGILKNELGYTGLVFTDALEMKGISKFYPEGEASVRSLLAGNDLLCLPGDVPGSIKKTLKAIRKRQLSWDDINARVKKVLLAKYKLGLNHLEPIDTTNITNDINSQTLAINRSLSANAITMLKQDAGRMFPITNKKIAYLALGVDSANHIATQMKQTYNADVYTSKYNKIDSNLNFIMASLKDKYDVVIIGMHNFSRRPANNYGLSASSIGLINQLQQQGPTITMVFGNPYAIKAIAATATNLVACYEDDQVTQQAAFEVLQGKLVAKGKLPVTVTEELKFGAGIVRHFFFQPASKSASSLPSQTVASVDSIALDAIANKVTPGFVVLVAKDGQVAFHKAYGNTTFTGNQPVSPETIYDLASITKTAATTLAVMKLYENGKLSLDKTLGDYLPWVKGSNKEELNIRKVLLHQAGLVGWVPFYQETLNKDGSPSSNIYSTTASDVFSVRVAENLYMRQDWTDTMYQRILTSRMHKQDTLVYSDLDFIFLGKVVEAITGVTLDQYVRETFYQPLGLSSMTFQPRKTISLEAIAPTEKEKLFRLQQLHGDVHDPGAAMFGGVAGHAGLFGNAYELAVLYQMLLNGGEINGIRFFDKKTVDLFTNYNSTISSRGLGFDKPSKENATRKVPYPAASASPGTFGHTGFTGTCVWADPALNMVYVFLSNRLAPGSDPAKLLGMNIRGKIHEQINQSFLQTQADKSSVGNTSK